MAGLPHTCLYVEDGAIQLQVPLSRLTEIDTGIKEALAARLNYFCDSLNGKVIFFKLQGSILMLTAVGVFHAKMDAHRLTSSARLID